MANAEQKGPRRESGEFAGFMADIVEEIEQRVASILPDGDSPAAPPAPPEAVISEWDDVTDRMIEEMR